MVYPQGYQRILALSLFGTSIHPTSWTCPSLFHMEVGPPAMAERTKAIEPTTQLGSINNAVDGQFDPPPIRRLV